MSSSFRSLGVLSRPDAISMAIVETILSEERRGWSAEQHRARTIAFLYTTARGNRIQASDFYDQVLRHIRRCEGRGEFEIGHTIRTKDGGSRITYRPDWDSHQPWVSYRNGTAGRHYVSPGAAQGDGFNLETDAERAVRLTALGVMP